MIAVLLALQQWTLGHLGDEAVRSNPQAAQAQAQVQSARAQLTEAERAWWPNFSIEGNFNPAYDVRCSNAGLPADHLICVDANVHNLEQSIPDGVVTRWELRLVQPLYTAGKLSVAPKLAGAGESVAEARLEAARGDLRLAVARAYWDAKVARAVARMLEDARKHADEALARAKKVDVLRLTVRVADLDTRREDARKLERIALAVLHTLVPTTPAEPDLGNQPLAPIDLPERPLDFYIQAAHLHRAEAQMIAFGLDAARANVKLRRGYLGPDVILAGSIYGQYWTTNSEDSLGPYNQHPYATFGFGGGLILRWEGSLAGLPRWRRAGEDYEAARAGSRAAMDGIGLEVTQVYETVQEARQRMDILVEGNKDATRWLDLAQKKFADKKADAREFTDALVGYLDAHTAYLWAIHDFNASVAWLSRVTGIEVSNLQHPADH